MRPQITSKTTFVLAFFVPAVAVQTCIIFPVIIYITQRVLRGVSKTLWFTAYYFARLWGSAAFFAGSPIHNLSLNLSGSKVALSARIFGFLSDEELIQAEHGTVLDCYARSTGHLYSQRTLSLYNTRLCCDTLYEGPANHVGDPAKNH